MVHLTCGVAKIFNTLHQTNSVQPHLQNPAQRVFVQLSTLHYLAVSAAVRVTKQQTSIKVK